MGNILLYHQYKYRKYFKILNSVVNCKHIWLLTIMLNKYIVLELWGQIYSTVIPLSHTFIPRLSHTFLNFFHIKNFYSSFPKPQNSKTNFNILCPFYSSRSTLNAVSQIPYLGILSTSLIS